jgi:hypothetical protein
MKTLRVEWRHIRGGLRECGRCAATGRHLHRVMADFRACMGNRVRIQLVRKTLPGAAIDRSNEIRINGLPLERWIPGSRIVKTRCPGCSRLLRRRVACRALQAGVRIQAAISEAMLRKAFCAASGCPNCGC